MLAKVKVIENNQARTLTDSLDLFKYSEERVYDRIVELGYSSKAEVLVLGFTDWDVGGLSMPLHQAYYYKRIIESKYAGDEYIVSYLLSRHVSVSAISNGSYRFISKSDYKTLQHFFKDSTKEQIISAFKVAGSWNDVILMFVQEGLLLNTPRGFYEWVK
ncbi:hypothetical protein [Streptococcus ferus]|uniref:hypothetical protein n=1 Tax=Streptococcus ferus TaxID=1345 RepID=UPI0023535B93|nr:hypothetical protein [Streptococcus ferus]